MDYFQENQSYQPKKKINVTWSVIQQQQQQQQHQRQLQTFLILISPGKPWLKNITPFGKITLIETPFVS